MVSAVPPETDTPVNTVKLDRAPCRASLIGINPDSEVGPISREGGVVLRFNRSGSFSAQILSDESDEEDVLRQRLQVAQPLLGLPGRIFTV